MKNKIAKYHIICLALSVFVALFSSQLAFAEDDDYLVTYPDGSYGVDLGGGYEVMPNREGRGGLGATGSRGGELILPYGYREDYKNTQYGAMTQRGFVTFPGFRFSDAARIEKADKKRLKEEEEGKKEKDMIFQEATTSAGSSIWGISSPR